MTAPSTTKITPATTSMWALHRATHRIMDRGATRMTCTMSGPGTTRTAALTPRKAASVDSGTSSACAA